MRLRGCLNMICENHEGQALFFQKAVEKGDEKNSTLTLGAGPASQG